MAADPWCPFWESTLSRDCSSSLIDPHFERFRNIPTKLELQKPPGKRWRVEFVDCEMVYSSVVVSNSKNFPENAPNSLNVKRDLGNPIYSASIYFVQENCQIQKNKKIKKFFFEFIKFLESIEKRLESQLREFHKFKTALFLYIVD